jgi:hypothetical protein
MEATNHRDTSLPQSQSQIVRAQNDIARAAGGTEKAKQWLGQNVEIAEGPYLGTGSQQRPAP